jgi:hypothetical protein
MSHTSPPQSKGGAKAGPSATKVGHHFENGKSAEIHIVGSGFDPSATDTSVLLAGSVQIGNISVAVSWDPNPAPAQTVRKNRVITNSKPTWSTTGKGRGGDHGIGSLTATVTNAGQKTNPITEYDIDYQ